MTEPNAIVLSLTLENIEVQCQDVIKQTRTASHALAALITLQTFIATTVQQADRYSPAYEAAKTIIENHAISIRSKILAESADDLAKAIQQHDLQKITSIHAALSRNGFWQVSLQAIKQFKQDDLVASATWTRNWCDVAMTQAQAASGYPDALDFSKAGIAPTEYAAMTEIQHYLTDALR